MTRKDEFAALRDIVLGRDPIHAQQVVAEIRVFSRTITGILAVMVVGSLAFGAMYVLYTVVTLRGCQP